jgi:hypothetical protein
MKVSTFLWSALTAVILVIPATGQSLLVEVDVNATAPRLPNGKPDLSGVWNRPGAQDLTLTVNNANGTSIVGEPNPLPFTEWGQAQWDNYDANQFGDYAGSCMPFGWMRSFTPHPMQILQNNEYIAFLFEQSTMFQVVNTEGVPHRDEWPPTWFGDSRGRWDGDTLIIEALNFNGWTKLGTIGHPVSDQGTLTMTFERPDMGHIRFGWTLEDPKTYTRPIGGERVFALTPDVEVMEYACMEGNLGSLIAGSITPWLGYTDVDANRVYPPQRQWDAYDETGRLELTGVVREVSYEAYGLARIEVDGRMLTVVLAPVGRLNFRRLTEEVLRVGRTISIQGLPSRETADEIRAEIVTIDGDVIDMR